MLNQNFVYIGILIAGVGAISYFSDTVKGKIQPNKVSFALWSIAPIIAFFAEIKEGVGIQSLLTLFIGLSPFIIFIGSFVNKKAYWKISKFDLSCGILSLIGLLLWFITKKGDWAIIFSILADGFAWIPTIIKAYKFPKTESAWPWGAEALFAIITILTVKNWKFAVIGFPIYYFIGTVITFILVQFKIGNRR